MSTINPEILAVLAQASKGAYGDLGTEVDGYTVIDGKDDPFTGLSLTIYKSINKQEYIFAFRGTELSSQDIYTDLNAGMQQWTLTNSQAVEAKIREYTSQTPGAFIHFTGHSLGGALAQFAAYEYAAAVGDPENAADLLAPYDLVTFNALGGVLGLGDPLLYTSGYDTSLAQSINAAHFKIASDVVSRLGDDHVGGELLVIDRPVNSPIDAHAIANFTGDEESPAVTVQEYTNALVEDNYLDITQLIGVSGILASVGDDGKFSSDEALLRTISAFAFGLAHADSADLSQLVSAFFGEASAIGQAEHDVWVFLGQQAIDALQFSRLGTVYGNGIGAYALTLANVLQWSAQFWEEYPGIADTIGISIDTFIASVASPAASLISSALEFAQENEFIAGEYQDAVDFMRNTVEWVDRFLAVQTTNEMYIQGTEADDLLSGRDSYWPGKSSSDHIFGFAGNDSLEGGEGTDYLVGGAGSDTFIWNNGDGSDVIGDYDDGGDRIIVNGVDLATLVYTRVSAASPFYRDALNPDITLHYDGDFLTVNTGGGIDTGDITITQYSPATGADYGISLQDPGAGAAVTDITVTRLGSGAAEVDSSAYWRQQTSQGGNDWANIAVRFNAVDVANYTGGSRHGTVGGAFEGGPVSDHLVGNADSNALHGLAGADLIAGGEGADFLEGGKGSDELLGGAGDDILFGSARAGLADSLDTASQQGQFYLPQLLDVAGDVNVLDAGAGDDFVSGGQYTDYIDGGAGSNYLLAGTGRDYVEGGEKRDVIYGDSTLNYRYVELTPGVIGERLEIAFAGGADSVAQYDDLVLAGSGNDTVWGELGNDAIYGQGGDDNLIGDRFNDPAYFSAELSAYASTSPDLPAALHGNDRLYGGNGNDLLLGLGGNDLLAGGKGADSLVGGADDDIYYLQPGEGLDYIHDNEGFHTLLFSGIDAGDLKVLFQGEQVLIGTGYGADGFYLPRSQWPNVRIALDSPDVLIERSRLDTHYYDTVGNLLISVPGSSELTEADRDALFTVDASDPDQPRIAAGAGIDTVEIEALAVEGGGAVVRFVSDYLQFVVNLAAAQIATGFSFLDLADDLTLSMVGFSGDVFGSESGDRIVGSGQADTIHGGYGDDVLSGRDGDDYLDGGPGADVLYGEAGRDHLYGGQGHAHDFIDGGRGDDLLDGGAGSDTFFFERGDGNDLLQDPDGALLEFGSTVNPEAVVMYRAGTDETAFRVQYTAEDAVHSDGSTPAHWIEGVFVDDVAIPLVQRSDLSDGVLRDTRWNDVFEGRAGNDTIHVSGWGEDVFRFFTGDGEDTIRPEEAYYPTLMGQISLAADVDLDSVSFSFLNGDTTVAYGGGDKILLDADTVATPRDNALSRFELVSEGDPQWIPTIQAQGYVGRLYGSYGSDHIIGGVHSETILPGYGNDLIEAGDGADTIDLTDLYINEATAGIGHKLIAGGGDSDIVRAPVHQGLTLSYQPGDGDDTIEYDWSYSSDHPYRLTYSSELETVVFQPHGQDVLAFGEGVTLAELSFTRLGSALQIAFLQGPGSIHIDEFFHAWDMVDYGETNNVSELFGPDNAALDSLLHPAILAAMPSTPIGALQFADGSRHDMALVLAAMLEDSNATVLGTAAADYLEGTEADDVIYALAGADSISDYGGSNFIDAGEGNDEIAVAGDNEIEPGPGDDLIDIEGGTAVIRFGPGSGSDFSIMDTATGNVVVAMAPGITPADVTVTLEQMDWGASPQLTLPATGDSIALVGLRYVAELDDEIADFEGSSIEVRFADGAVFAGADILGMGQVMPGPSVVGTSGSDLLEGTAGNDTLLGEAGRDTLTGLAGDDILVGGRGRDKLDGGTGHDTYVFAAGDGRDVINNAGSDLEDSDVLQLNDVDYDQVWLSRRRKHLLVNVAGSNDQVRIKKWFAAEQRQLDTISAGDHLLQREQVDQLVNAMAAFDVPRGVGTIIPEQVRMELEPTLASVWQPTG